MDRSYLGSGEDPFPHYGLASMTLERGPFPHADPCRGEGPRVPEAVIARTGQTLDL